MSARRLAKVAAGIRQVVSTSILFELRDPRVANVTVLGVDVAPDFRSAKVRVSIMGDEKQQRLALKGLQSACGFLQSRIAEELDLRYTPVLTIVRDDGVKKSIAVAMALREAQDADAGDAIEETPLDENNDEAVADGGGDTSHATDE
jgi:ribosome-binding factor A